MPLYVHNFATLIKGISNRDAGYDHEARWQATKEATLRFGWNFAPTNDVLASDFFASFGNKQMMWAGEEGGLPRRRAVPVGRERVHQGRRGR